MNDWRPGHSTSKGYPYDGIESQKQFVNRPNFFVNKEGKIEALIDMTMFPNVNAEQDESLRSFLFDRCFDFQEALKTAEDQLAQILNEEDPFIPEDFEFECIHKPKDTTDSPIRVYSSKLTPGVTIHRKPQDQFDAKVDNTIWHILIKKEDGTFNTPIEASIPCHRIAYALFYALKVKVVADEKEGSVAPVIEENPTTQEKTGLFDVEWNCANREPVILNNIPAESAQDAKTKAKFMIETGDYGDEVVDFDDLHVGVK